MACWGPLPQKPEPWKELGLMPTHKVTELLVPATELSDREWISVTEEWVRVLGPVFKGTRFPRLGELRLSDDISALDNQLARDHVEHELPLDLEGIWSSGFFSTPPNSRAEIPIWGLDRKGNWYIGSVEIQRTSGGYRSVYRLLSAEMHGSTLQIITQSVKPELILAEIRGQIAALQKRARMRFEHYEHYGQLLDGDLALLKKAGACIPY